MLLMLPLSSLGPGIISVPQHAKATPHLPLLSRDEYLSKAVVVISEAVKNGLLLLTATYALPEYLGMLEILSLLELKFSLFAAAVVVGLVVASVVVSVVVG